MVELKQTRIFLIAMSYHSKAARGRLELSPEAPDPFGLRLLRG
jgi:hypothetical protein